MLRASLKTLALLAYPFRSGRKALVRNLSWRWPEPMLWRGKYGIAYLLEGRNYIDGRILRQGIYEEAGVAAFCEAMTERRCDLFLDVGANIGVYAMAVAKNTPCREIVCFEPDPRNRNQLAATVFLNELDEVVQIRPEAVSDKIGTATFYAQRDRENPSSVQSRLTPMDSGAATEITVPLVTLDSVIPASGRRIAVKMDIEGHEQPALRGMVRLAEENDVLLQIEIFPRNYAEVEALLQELGFSLFRKITTNDFLFERRSLPA